MSKLHAQMALFGSIDEVVRRSDNPATAATVEKFLPGTTGVGQRGWYPELQRFLSKKELLPRDGDGAAIQRDGPVTFPSLSEAIDELNAPPADAADVTSPDVRGRSMYAALVLTKAMEAAGPRVVEMPGFEPFEGFSPLAAILPTVTLDLSGPIPGIDPMEGPAEDALPRALLELQDRFAYRNFTGGLARSSVLDPDAMGRPFCSGALRKIGGKFCTVLTTAWDTPFTLDLVKEIIDPHNWPKLCNFFVSMGDQAVLNPDQSRGWTRVLESVSGDKTQWEMRTALRYWKGLSRDKDAAEGIYINYDLDDPPRVDDCKLLEVDAGYIWATPINPADPNSLVRLRTCKQVRIRGVSTTATAALGCGFGWGDAMSQMFRVEDPPVGNVAFGAPSVEQPIVIGPGNAAGVGMQRPAAADAEAAEDVELLPGWRGAIINAMRDQLSEGIERANRLGTDFAVRWSDGDGFSLEDVNKFGTECGREMTEYATGMFEAAAAAIQPPSDDTNAKGGYV